MYTRKRKWIGKGRTSQVIIQCSEDRRKEFFVVITAVRLVFSLTEKKKYV